MTELVRVVLSDPEPVIVYTEYIETLRTLQRLLERAGARVWVYSGQLRQREKSETLASFRAQGGVLLSTEVGGQGLNLQHCHRMVNFDLPWNPMRLEQRIGRIHRFGQQEPVQIINITAAGTFEEVLQRVLLSKIRLFELVIGEIDSILAYLQDPIPLDQRIGRMILESPSMAVLGERMEQLAEELASAQRALAEDQMTSARVLDLPAGSVTT
jgi:SNF2 family DNA or RNA helicase